MDIIQALQEELQIGRGQVEAAIYNVIMRKRREMTRQKICTGLSGAVELHISRRQQVPDAA